MRLQEMYYVQVFCGNISAGQIMQEFVQGVYNVEAIDTDDIENSPTYIKLITLNDFITGGYVFFKSKEEAVAFIDRTKTKMEEAAKQQKEEVE